MPKYARLPSLATPPFPNTPPPPSFDQWDKTRKGWLLPAAARSAAEKAIKGEEVTAAEVLSFAAPDPPSSAGAHASVLVENYKRAALLVTGDVTGDSLVKPVLQALGGTWLRGPGGWCLQRSKKEQVLRVLRGDETVEVREGKEGAKKKKRKSVELVDDLGDSDGLGSVQSGDEDEEDAEEVSPASRRKSRPADRRGAREAAAAADDPWAAVERGLREDAAGGVKEEGGEEEADPWEAVEAGLS